MSESAEPVPFTRDEEFLVAQAVSAAERAYCPYSKFPVGAAVESEIGITIGCNIENASYGLAICAERVALFRAVAQGAKRFSRIAVACIKAEQDAPFGSRMPCGACRQVIAELMPATAVVLVAGVGAFCVADLLPHAFQLADTPFLNP